jgi:hypothetical protein
MDIDEIHGQSSPSRPSDDDSEFAGDGDEAEEGSGGAHSSADAERASRQVDTQTAIAELAEAQQVHFRMCNIQLMMVVTVNAFCMRESSCISCCAPSFAFISASSLNPNLASLFQI